MVETNTIDLAVALLVFFAGSASLHHAIGIWRVRNGNILTLALCLKLFAFFIWGVIILILTLHEWQLGTMTSVFARSGTIADRLVLTIPQLFIVLWVIPKAKR